ncbi:TrbI/VirB10 family protein [Phenylobacterium sp.]|uniref:TrbI/VirB10 family protein n=1 Tax=Phenylobacterium sp. TaxID=1871053 RepID=UPI0011FD6955|nr:TrbI/VirB10 family protein [Phenylobacterium sp.]THD63899.1 MAG: type VI secretion protein [Phenylobacterium sp.]
MTDMHPPEDQDFEPVSDEPGLTQDDAEPIVARTPAGGSPLLAVAGFSAAALALFLVLNHRRVERSDPVAAPGAIQTAQETSGAPPSLELKPILVSAPGPAAFTGLPTTVDTASPPAATPRIPQTPTAASTLQPISAADSAQRLHAPTLVVDFGGAPRDMVVAQAGPPPAPGAVVAPGGSPTPGGARPQLNDSEQFAKRVGDEEPERSRAIPMHNLHATAPQGTIIPGVLETAIDSDLPGFTRAVVSRDVLSFDGKAVLIPKGSRLIGQYKSAVALGQSRAFIIWTRVIRPDGVSIQIGSPGTDELGRAGLDGDVNRHFFRRFSGSILLSVLNAGVAAVGQTPSTEISIGSPGAATGLATSAIQGDAIPPTIKVKQGEAINIFVARDLDFSGVEPIR